jgi:rhamnose transport system permease protein
LAEALTRGLETYRGFPSEFLFWGQGYLGGIVPPQLFVLLVASIGVWWWLHRSIYGRSLYAIGFSAEGARYAGIPVARRLLWVYVLSGWIASLAAIIYVAHLGQAKSDAGTGYELMAITAVVLGGTSIYGGRGTVLGTGLGLFAVVILQNGLRLSGQPAELAGILTGALLLTTILIDRYAHRERKKLEPRKHEEHAGEPVVGSRWPVAGSQILETRNPKLETLRVLRGENNFIEDFEVKNSHVAILSAVILAAALIVAGSNWLLVRSLQQNTSTSVTTTNNHAATPSTARKLTVAMMPKAKGDPYFASCRQGAEEAAKELGIELLWDGPTDLDPAKQNEVVEAWITRGVDVIAVAVSNKEGISTVLRKARQKGIKVLTWDADAQKDARDFLVNQATPQGIGYTLVDEAARIMNGAGEFAIITGSLSADNQNEWIKHIKARVAEKFPNLKLVGIQPSDDDRDRAFTEAQNIMKTHPNVKLIMAISAPAVPGSAEAVKQSGRKDIKVMGLSLPNLCKPYVHEDVTPSVILWNTIDLGYLVVHSAKAVSEGTLKPGTKELMAGRKGKIVVEGDEVILGPPFVFNKGNIDQYNF